MFLVVNKKTYQLEGLKKIEIAKLYFSIGFLNLELPNCLGNMGMKDQVMAMKWVKENIKFFGGDPDNITLYGNSSGASDVHLHIISPLSKGKIDSFLKGSLCFAFIIIKFILAGLFNKTIRQGGYALNTLFGYQTDHIKRAYDLAELLGLEEKNARRLLRLLKKVTALELVTAVSELAYKLKKVKDLNVCLLDDISHL